MKTVMAKPMRVTKTTRIVTEGVKIKNKMYLQVKKNRPLISLVVIRTESVKVQHPQIPRTMVMRTVQGPVARLNLLVGKVKSIKEAIPMPKES